MRRCTVLLVVVSCLCCTRSVRADTVAHWRFEEGSPNTVATGADSVLDSSGNNLHGTPSGGPIYRSVSNPGSTLGLEFDGVDDFVMIADDPLFQLTGSLTLEAYIRIDSYAKSGEIVWRGDDRGARDPYRLKFHGDGNSDPSQRRTVRFAISDGSTDVGINSPALPLGQMLHVAGTLDDATGQMRLFVDGDMVAETITARRPFGALDPGRRPRVVIGTINQTGGDFFDGIIDEVRISDVALPIPEPSAAVLLGMGAIGMAFHVCRRRRRTT